MQTGSSNAFINQFVRQFPVNNDITLRGIHLNGVAIVDNSGGPVTVTLPSADSIRAGGYFQVFALTAANPVTVAVQPGDSYNAGLVAPVVLTQAGEMLTIFATNEANLWRIPLVGGGAVDLPPVVADAYQLNPAPGPPIPRQSPPVALTVLQPSYTVDFNTLRFDGSGTVELRTIRGQPPVGTLTINGWVFAPWAAPLMDAVRVDFNTSAHNVNDVYELVFRNNEGGEAAIIIATGPS